MNVTPKKQIVAIGEVLWDLFPDGRKVGGAPGNFAFHCSQLGAEVLLLSAVGADPLGQELLQYFTQMALPTEGIVVLPDYPTGTVRVECRDGEPRYTICEGVAWDHIKIPPDLLPLIAEADVFYYGSLVFRTEKMQELFRRVFDVIPKSALKVFDVNLRAPFYRRDSLISLLEKANILKLNVDELAIISDLLDWHGMTRDESAQKLRQQFDYDMLILTDGQSGAFLLTDHGHSQYASVPVKVVDTVGAGDSFAAQAVMGWLDGHPIDEINRRANDLAAYVCTCRGGTPHHANFYAARR